MARYLHIGEAIEARVNQLRMSQAEFGAKIGVAQQNIRRIFEKESIDTDRLVAISAALNFNFFELYCELSTIKVVGTGNQVNQTGASYNSNAGSPAPSVESDLLNEKVRHLEAMLKEKDERISDLKERISELKTKTQD